MFPPNARITQIDERNQQMLRAATQFQADLKIGKASLSDLPKLKQQYPSFGVMPCHAAGLDFVMFHAHDDIVVWEYLWRGPDGYETDLVRTWVDWCRKTPGDILDIGAYTGLMSILAARAHPENAVHLFEPLERIIERANVNVKLNGLGQRIQRHPVAASDSNDTAEITLYRGENALGTGSGIGVKANKVPVTTKTIPTVRIDDYLPDIRPTAIKVDVEGHELAALNGLERTIATNRPNMLIESWDHSRSEVLALMERHGYVMQRTEPEDRSVNNYIATPR